LLCWIVLLSIPNEKYEIDNIYGIGVEGNKLWRIENPVKAFSVDKTVQGYDCYANSIYTGFDLNEDGTISGYTYMSMCFTADCMTGKLTKENFIRF